MAYDAPLGNSAALSLGNSRAVRRAALASAPVAARARPSCERPTLTDASASSAAIEVAVWCGCRHCRRGDCPCLRRRLAPHWSSTRRAWTRPCARPCGRCQRRAGLPMPCDEYQSTHSSAPRCAQHFEATTNHEGRHVCGRHTWPRSLWAKPAPYLMTLMRCHVVQGRQGMLA